MGDETKQSQRVSMIVAFATVYLIWGSTYLGIRYAIETIPPLLMAGSRFALAGAALLLFARLRAGATPTRREWGAAALTGILMLGAGNGGVTWAQQTVPSGIAALVASAIPLWMALLDWARPGGARPTTATAGGLFLGTAGLLLLLGGGAGEASSLGPSRIALVVLVGATITWAAGSVAATRVRLPSSPLMATGAQMFIGGTALLAVGLLSGEGADFHPAAMTARSLLAWVYLVVFGSLIAFTAYAWLLRETTPAKVSTYAFVNPMVAVFLGAWLAAEPLDARTVAAMVVILTGVALIVLNRGRPTEPAHARAIPLARVDAREPDPITRREVA